MKPANFLSAGCLASTTFVSAAIAHEGHGIPGTIGHDLQHQLWTFAALVAVGALLLAGDRVIAALRVGVRRKRDGRDSTNNED
ncbi:MAG TPA: hypothetical protein VGE69_09665 [Pseudomonadales bacterium]